MAEISRPNRDALARAIDIFRDVMRPFLIRCLVEAPGVSPTEAVRRTLRHEQQVADFNRNLEQRGDLESALDVNHFPRLVDDYSREVYAARLGGDRRILRRFWSVRGVRNEVAHPPARDLDAGIADGCLLDIAFLLGKAGEPQSKRAVEGIRHSLANRRRQEQAANGAGPGRDKRPAAAGPKEEVVRVLAAAAFGAVVGGMLGVGIFEFGDERALSAGGMIGALALSILMSWTYRWGSKSVI